MGISPSSTISTAPSTPAQISPGTLPLGVSLSQAAALQQLAALARCPLTLEDLLLPEVAPAKATGAAAQVQSPPRCPPGILLPNSPARFPASPFGAPPALLGGVRASGAIFATQ